MTRFELDDTGVGRFAVDAHDRGLRATVGALRAALAGATDEQLVLAPYDAPVDAPADADPGTAWATVRPVTDAVKQVVDGVLVRTVDRGPLRWAAAPAALPRAALQAALAGRPDDEVVEPLALVGPLEVRP